MSTPAQHTANINNSRLSTGPATAQGKAASSQNARKHGLTGAQVVVKGESLQDFESLKADLTAQYAPATATEQIYVNEIAENYWRLMRARRIETELLDREMETSLAAGDATLSTAFINASADLDKVRRYMVSIERAWHRAIAQLASQRREREAAVFQHAERQRADEKAARSQAAAECEQAMHDYFMAPTPDQIGFVSQTAAGPLTSPSRTSRDPRGTRASADSCSAPS
jgi:hypothetical protein